MTKKGKVAMGFSPESHKVPMPLCHIGAVVNKDVRNAKIQEEREEFGNKEVQI